MKIENDLGRDDICQLVLRLAIPSMLAQFINVLYSVVDRIYIGNIPVIGETALAGVGVSGPIVTLISAFAYLVGLGGSPLMSIRMGEGQDEKAKKILANSFWMIVGLSAVLTLVLFVFKREILTRFGASEAILPYAESYFTIYLLGTVFALLSIGMNQFIICQGFARIGMISVALGAVTNIVLDPVFIFVFDMGVAGAAFATVLSQFASAVFVLRFLRGNRVFLRLEFECPQVKTVCKIALMGLSPFLIIAFDNVLIISLNTVIQMYGGAEADMAFDLYDNRAELYADRDDAARRHYIGNGGDPGLQFRRGDAPESDPERTEVYHIAGGGAVQHHVPVFLDAGAVFCVSLYAQ